MRKYVQVINLDWNAVNAMKCNVSILNMTWHGLMDFASHMQSHVDSVFS